MSYLALVVLVCLVLAGTVQAAVQTRDVEYRDGETVLQGYMAWDDAVKGKRPGVLVIHQWMGLTDYEKGRARQLAELGYVAFALDMYGKDARPKSAEDAAKLAGICRSDRALMRSRARAGLDALMQSEVCDTKRVAAMGYCFGGGCALELARSGAPLVGTVSFHGNLDTPNPDDAKKIRGSVLVCHGADDPHVTAEQVLAFEQEMRDAKVDWELNAYGNAVHAFTQPGAGNDPSRGAAYNAKADRRSWEAMQAFFKEVFKQG
jgi:dienelactone hydrolase